MCAATELHLLEPFWTSPIIYREGLFFIQEADDQPPVARLLMSPREVLSLRSATALITYQPDRDYTINAAAQRVELPAGSRVPFRRRRDMYLPPESPMSIPHRAGDPQQHLYFSEGHVFHHQQAEISYTTDGRWDGFVPRFAGDQLPRTMQRLEARDPMQIAVVGDSICAGGNASQDVEPYMPAFPQLVAMGLREVFGSAIHLTNLAKGGTSAGYGVEVAPQIAQLRPDLTIIAFGMNDVGGPKPEPYARRIGQIMHIVREANPDAEFVLVATMLANPEWSCTPAQRFAPFRDALATLSGPGAALADLTSLWADLLQRKNYHDLTGNGVNHANDFGHRLYAQTILTLMVESMSG